MQTKKEIEETLLRKGNEILKNWWKDYVYDFGEEQRLSEKLILEIAEQPVEINFIKGK